MNKSFVELVSRDILNIDTPFLDCESYEPQGQRQERLLDILAKLGADTYLSGPSARSYIDVGPINQRDIRLEWMDYSGYPEYPQLYGKFEHSVSILDLLFNTGSEAPWYIWGWREEHSANRSGQ